MENLLKNSKSFSPSRTKVAVAMSGGVDSSVAAALLVEQGYEVIGITANLLEPESCDSRSKTCCSSEDIRDAKQICKQLGISHRIIDQRFFFDREIVRNFSEAWAAGHTPNPCVMCNQLIKFGTLLVEMKKAGCNFLATGHYVRREGNYLLRGVDRQKDQSYFCYSMGKSALEHALFPLGGMTKEEVRLHAKRLGLPERVAVKRESMDICFVGSDYKQFLRDELGNSRRGPVIDDAGNQICTHEGIWTVTIGQRFAGTPLYVTGKDSRSNTIFVGSRPAARAVTVHLADQVWLSEHSGKTAVQMRHRGLTIDCTVDAESGKIRFVTDALIATGQHAVIYQSDLVVGGGRIVSVTTEE